MASLESIKSSVADQLSGAFSGIGTGFSILMICLLVAVVIGVIGYFIVQHRRYNKTITILENIAGLGYVPAGKDRAVLIKVGDRGEEILYLQKRKVYRVAHGKKIGVNNYLFAIGSDGYWYNCTFGDLEEGMKKVGLEPVPQDARLIHSGIHKNIQNQFNKTSWLQQNLGWILGVSTIVIVLVFMWLLADKWLTISNASNAGIELSNQGMQRINELLTKMDNLCAGGSGLVRA